MIPLFTIEQTGQSPYRSSRIDLDCRHPSMKPRWRLPTWTTSSWRARSLLPRILTSLRGPEGMSLTTLDRPRIHGLTITRLSVNDPSCGLRRGCGAPGACVSPAAAIRKRWLRPTRSQRSKVRPWRIRPLLSSATCEQIRSDHWQPSLSLHNRCR